MSTSTMDSAASPTPIRARRLLGVPIQGRTLGPEGGVKRNVRSRGYGPGLLTLLLFGGFVFVHPLEAHWKIDPAPRQWKVLDTVRFRIHYTAGFEETALAAALYAEQAADRCASVLEHRIGRVVPVFIFPSQQDFSSTNIFPGIIGEGTGGFTDFLRRRVVVPFTGDYDQLRHVLTHEIAHAYQFDILGGNYGRYPLWLMEGMAEYIALGWDASGEVYVRDLVLHGRFPSLARLHAGQVPGFAFYKAGQVVSFFVAQEFGEEYIGRLLKDLRVYRRVDYAIQSTFELRAEEFDQRMQRWVRARYSQILSLAPSDRRVRDVTLRYRTGKGFNIRPIISPDGRRIAYLTSDRIFPAVALRAMPGPDVLRRKVEEERIVVRALRSAQYEEWHPQSVRLSFTPDGREVVLSARDHGRQAIVWVSLKTGKIVRSLTPPFDSIQYPALSPDGATVAFTGVNRGRSDLYLLTLKTGVLRRITADSAHETDPAFSRGGGYIYYTAGATADSAGKGRQKVFRKALRSEEPSVAVTDTPGSCDTPMPGLDGTLVVRCDFGGVPNLYRLANSLGRKQPAGIGDLTPITQSPTGISGASLRIVAESDGTREMIALCEYEEGAYEVRVLPGQFVPGSTKAPVTAVPELPAASRTFDPATYENPTARWPLSVPFQPKGLKTGYQPGLAFEGAPFILIAGSSGDSGQTSLAVFAFAQMADDTGNHRLRTFINYHDRPTTLNADIQYLYLKHRMDLFVGAYNQSGTFPISNFLDFSFNNILYNPNFRLIDQQSTGVYGGVDYPLHRFGAVTAALEQGRDEKIFRQPEAEEREQDDIYKNFTQASFAYRYDNAVYSIFGPLDGTSLLLGYSVPLQTGVRAREVYTTSFQYRFYHLFENFGVFAFRMFGGLVSGRDAPDYPYRIGGFYTLRGYDFLEFEGTHAFLTNVEYRFPLINDLRFAFPGDWSIGAVRGIFFFDAGAAFDDPREFQGYDAGVGVTRDAHLSFGIGIHWVNFLFPFIPGSIMKIEWATPYDTKRALPLSKWRGQFSLGFSFD